MPVSADVKTLHGKLAAASRWHNPDRDSIAQDLAAARIADYIERVVSTAPPLTSDQRSRLAALLVGDAA